MALFDVVTVKVELRRLRQWDWESGQCIVRIFSTS
jgi:hypothetical protein